MTVETIKCPKCGEVEEIERNLVAGKMGRDVKKKAPKPEATKAV
jgi:phage FluMu protein Com